MSCWLLHRQEVNPESSLLCVYSLSLVVASGRLQEAMRSCKGRVAMPLRPPIEGSCEREAARHARDHWRDRFHH